MGSILEIHVRSEHSEGRIAVVESTMPAHAKGPPRRTARRAGPIGKRTAFGGPRKTPDRDRPNRRRRLVFVLIPGAGTDPRVYAATIDALADLGRVAVAPPLPLDDDGATPTDHAHAVAAAVGSRRDVVVVAQSLGAFSGPLVAARIPVAGLILLAPMIPKPGETAGEWWTNTGHAEAIAPLLERHGPMSEWGPEAMQEVFLHDVDPEVARANERYNRTPGAGMFSEPWPLDVWPDVPTRVLAPRDDRLFPLPFQRRVARERLGLDVEVIPGGHLPMLARPRELAENLVRFAAE